MSNDGDDHYPLVNFHITIEITIEIVDFPIKDCDFP